MRLALSYHSPRASRDDTRARCAFGLATPVVTCHPDHGAAWEGEAGAAEIVCIAEAADRLGYHHLTCSEHVAIPVAVAPVRGARYYDPLATFGFLAARTERIRFATHVVVLPYHHPLAIAKAVRHARPAVRRPADPRRSASGLSRRSSRSSAPTSRHAGPRYEDAIRALRAAFGRRDPAYAGSHYRFADVLVDPCGIQRDVPIWLGGRSARSLRRALALADGWDPFGLSLAELEALLDRARESRAWSARRRRSRSSSRRSAFSIRPTTPPGWRTCSRAIVRRAPRR
jgi:alkanesulfonate monooxygenase SsuD/methylene tetrahydromethanopterin reductase-like flavin-dependent oxidoreductase (luciferase family)